MTAWIYIFIGVILGGLGDFLMKASQGFTYLWMGILALCVYATSAVLWGIAIKTLPLGSTYAIWTGAGAFTALCVGALFFGEMLTPLKAFFVSMILIGCIGLKVFAEAS